MFFRDRTDAGRRLAAHLKHYHGDPNLLILGLPRGGVAVAFEVAESLHVPLDVIVVRKIGVPGREELAMGAIASGNVVVRNRSIIRAMNISEQVFQSLVQREREELIRYETSYRNHRPPPEFRGRSVILVDDGLATGATMKAAVKSVRIQQPVRVVVAVPVAAPSACESVRPIVDDFVCLIAPESFFGVSQWYENFRQTTDDEVSRLLEGANQRLMPTEGVTGIDI